MSNLTFKKVYVNNKIIFLWIVYVVLLVADRRAGQRPALTQVDAHKFCTIEKDVKRDDDNLEPIKIMLLGLSICLIPCISDREK